jgi:predicted nuclease of predicted toxin-antitoxin system
LNFLIDARLPSRLALWLGSNGHNAIHTLDLPLKNNTGDSELIALADREDRVVVTKDADFFESWLIKAKPRRPAIITTGNIGNDDLLALFARNLNEIVSLLESHSVLEIGRDTLIIRA